MNPNARSVRFFLLGIVILLLTGALAACGGGSGPHVMYHCPMHPTYVSDHPGDCPICNMKLVPIEDAAATGTTAPPIETKARAESATLYHCPMHPNYISDRPGQCPICHMDLVPMGAPDESPGNAAATASPEGYSTVRASADAVRLAGVQTAVAVRDSLDRTVRAAGVVRADETRLHQVNTRVSGWVESLAVNFNGQFVRRGDPLLTLYSPELLGSQEEYLRSREAVGRLEGSSLPEVRDGAKELLDASRNRLLLFDAPESLIRNIERTGVPQHSVTLEAPATGYVMGKAISSGARIEPGTTLFVIADLSRVWVEADVYEYEAPGIALGSKAIVTLPYAPSYRREARVSYVYPTLDATTRTLRVRVELPNPDLTLRPDMFADVALTTESGQGVIIPDDAILDSGTRRIVFVETAPGTFEPREILLGVRSDGRAQILRGVAVGERVVVHANFLLDSESRLRAAISGSRPGSPAGAAESSGAMEGMTGHQHGGQP